MDPWGWENLRPRLELRIAMPVGPLLCVVDGPTRGGPWASDAARSLLRRVAAKAGVRRRFAPHQLRHAHAVELAREGVPLNVIQRQLGHTNLGVTSIYLQGIDNAEIIATVHARHAPMIRCYDRTPSTLHVEPRTDVAGPPVPLSSKSRTVHPRYWLSPEQSDRRLGRDASFHVGRGELSARYQLE